MNRSLFFSLLFLYPCFFLVNCGTVNGNESSRTETGQLTEEDHRLAEANYKEYCASCHGVQMQAFVDRVWVNGNSKKALENSIRSGMLNAGMPAFDTTFTESEIAGLAEYILVGIEERKSFDVGGVVSPEYYTSTYQNLKTDTVVDGIGIPWGLKVTPDGTMYFTEREGILSVRKPNGEITIISNTPAVKSRNQGGMMDIALHPDFANNSILYLSYSKVHPEKAGFSTTAVLRAKIAGDSLLDVEDIFEALPYSEMNHHYGSRLVFDNDGYLFISVGDRGARDDNPQSLKNFCGKIHRVKEDGSIPEDNPFVGEESHVGSIWSYGCRNPQGLAYDAGTNTLWENEHGPRGGDELNMIKKGINYGWPVASFGINYDGTTFTNITEKEDFTSPLNYWIPSIAPSGMAVVEGDVYGNWKGDVLTGSLRFNYVSRVKLQGEKVIEEEKILQDIGRVRCIEMGGDGYLYIGVESPGRILKISVVEEIPEGSNKDISFEIEELNSVEDLSHCESIAFDPARNVMYASLIGEDEDGDGKIARFNPDGSEVDRDFITGLNDPHGIAVAGDRLYTADGTTLVEINLVSQKVLNRYTGVDAVFLNDVAVDSLGNVYVSDMRRSAIYRLKDGEFSEWMVSPELDNPNGLLIEGNTMYISSWGPQWGVNGMLLKLDMDSREIEKIVPFRFGNLDGVQADGDAWLVSDWVSGAVYSVSKDGHPTKIVSTEMSVGDICYMPKTGYLYLPMNFQSKVLVYKYMSAE